MKKILFPLFLTFLASTAIEAKQDSFLFGHEDNVHIIVNNRVLAKVNGKAISVIDVMKKMDVLFFRQFPQYTSSVPARFQYYQANWKNVIRDIIDKELILADATENTLPVTNGDIRQEMENLFGPNIIDNLDKIGMTHDEAWNIVKSDIMLRRMAYFKVHMKSMREVTPQAIRAEYTEFAKNNIVPESYVYQVITVRDANAEKGKEIADKIKYELENKKIELSEFADKLKTNSPYGADTTVSLSEEFKHSTKEMSDAFKEVVLTLEAGKLSDTIAQKSRANNSTVYRIFNLIEKNLGGTVAFHEVENKIKEKLQNIAAEKEMTTYLKKLHQYFDVQESYLTEFKDDNYQPFTMK